MGTSVIRRGSRVRARREASGGARSSRRVAALIAVSAALVAAVAGPVAAAGAGPSVTVAQPQGEVAEVRQVRVRFDRPVVPLGDSRHPDPVAIRCSGAEPRGSGRWVGDREWLYDFADALPPGVACSAEIRGDWRPVSASAGSGASGPVGGTTRWSFSTGGPAVVHVRPWPGDAIEEEQAFILQFNGPVVTASVREHAACVVEGVGERLPVRLVEGDARTALLASQRLSRRVAERSVVVACERPLPAGVAMRLVVAPGVVSAAAPGLAGRAEQGFAWRVRAAFSAEFSCERERAGAPCWPVRPMSVTFSAPVARADAAQVRLRRLDASAAGGAAIAPIVDGEARDAEARSLRFPVPLAENASYQVELPPTLKDVTGRPLSNAASFPLRVTTAAAPPIAKFAAAPFAVVERGLDGSSGGVLPLTLRHLQPELEAAAGGALRPGVIRVRRFDDPREILEWLARVERHHERRISAREAGRPASEWTEITTVEDERGRPQRVERERRLDTRELSLLRGDGRAKRLELPPPRADEGGRGGASSRPLEVVGLPLDAPGYHVVEIESPRLGATLLDRPEPMFVRTGVLVTNLGVHFKHGRESSAAWVTSLDRGRPVPGADVAVHDCRGTLLWTGRTDAQGVARIDRALDPRPVAEPAGPTASRAEARRCPLDEGLFVVARHDAGGGAPADLAFVFSTWQRGIEPWRFDLPTSLDPQPDRRAHTVFDRTLLRTGETVSMKHFVRVETSSGLALPADTERPARAVLVHSGTGRETAVPIAWNGARSGTSAWAIPPSAALGRYEVWLERDTAVAAAPAPAAPRGRGPRLYGGSFRVEAFRVPLIDARLVAPTDLPPAPREIALGVQMSYLAGGGVQQSGATVSALLTPRAVAFEGFDGFRFEPPRALAAGSETPALDEEAAPATGRVVADKVAAPTDRAGAGRVVLGALPAVDRPSELLAELSFTDPSGETQTVAQRLALWPSAVVPGIRAASWASERTRTGVQVATLDARGAPRGGESVQVRGRLVQTYSTRKRLVGGFYAYENRTEVQELGVLCEGRSDERGLLRCDVPLGAAGEVELIAEVKDAAGRLAQAATSVWVTRQGDLWFAQDDDDRIELLPEKRRYAPGETARFQVRMPFREATALVAVEREGVVDTRVVTLRGDDPTVELKVEAAWTPNVYVSVLAVRGRIREVPWTSLFTWGWKSPLEWWRAWRFEGPQVQAPTSTVDLAKPTFRLGAAAIEVGTARHALHVSVVPDAPRYTIRQTAQARIRVERDGRPLAGGPAGAPVVDVAFAAVDEGLLALAPNGSWDLRAALIRTRPWGVATSTAQGEVVGRRHYGRKAVAAGGGGGRGATRELFDTLLVWRASVSLDERGEAVVPVPLNDSLTSFRLVAVADALIGDGDRPPIHAFGTGSATIQVSQDLQVLPGLPLVAREGDRFDALVTVRNTTAREMQLTVSLRGTPLAAAAPGTPATARASTPAASAVSAAAAAALAPIEPSAQTLTLAAGSAAELRFPVEVPAGAGTIVWDAEAHESVAAAAGGTTAAAGATGASDRVRRTQPVRPAVPWRVQQATIAPLEGRLDWAVAAPGVGAASLDGRPRGGLRIALQPRLADGLPGVRRWFEAYPYSCLEQRASRALALDDRAGWDAVVADLPAHLDADGLVASFPAGAAGEIRGSDRLTAYLVAAAHEAGVSWPRERLEPMLAGLTAFVEGRLERRGWAPGEGRSLDRDVRRLAALEALARHGRAQPRMLGSTRLEPATWPTAALLDWISILRRVPDLPDAERRLAQAQQVLRSRLAFSGTVLRFSREAADFWWWLMDSPDGNAARLILAAVDDPAWRDDLPRLVNGHLARQRQGAWLTTTANLWSVLALRKFSTRFEATPVAGRSVAHWAGEQAVHDWSGGPAGGTFELPWPPSPAAASGHLTLRHEGAGRPWVTVQALAAVPRAAPVRAGYGIVRSVVAVEQREGGVWSRGDIVRVRLEVDAAADMTWVVVDDPLPAGATVLGSGLGRDAVIARRDEGRPAAVPGDDAAARTARPAHVERAADAWRAYFEWLPRGRHVVEYTMRLNQSGRFSLPPTRVEAMYAPETHGEVPNAVLEVRP